MILNLNTSFHKTTSKGSIQEQKAHNLTEVQKWLNHNHRTYDNDDFCYSKIDKTLSYLNNHLTSNLTYKEWFNQQIPKSIIDEYNAKQSKKSRTIKNYDYLNFITNKPKLKQAIAEQLIVQLGSDNELKDIKQILKTDDDWIKFWKNYQLNLKTFFKDNLPEFKIYDMSLHLDETSPHIHIVGAGFQATPDAKQGLKYRLASTNIFTRDKLKYIHKSLREFNQQQTKLLQELINNKHIYYDVKTQTYIQTNNPKRRYENIILNANQTNLNEYKNIKDKELANVLSKLKTNQLTKNDELILYDEISSKINKKYDKELTKNQTQTIILNDKLNQLAKLRVIDDEKINRQIQQQVNKQTNHFQLQLQLKQQQIFKLEDENLKQKTTFNNELKQYQTKLNNELQQHKTNLSNNYQWNINQLEDKIKTLKDDLQLAQDTIDKANDFVYNLADKYFPNHTNKLINDYAKQTNQELIDDLSNESDFKPHTL